MAFCKVCACGEKIVFERRLSFPDNCPACGRKLVDFLTYNEDDPRVAQLVSEAAAARGVQAGSEDQGAGAGQNGIGAAEGSRPGESGQNAGDVRPGEGGWQAGSGRNTGIRSGDGGPFAGAGLSGGDMRNVIAGQDGGGSAVTGSYGGVAAGSGQTGGELHPALRFALQFENGERIEIPEAGGIVGRTGEGGELLAGYPSVSRQHVRLTPRRSVGVILEDLSTYGTLVDGKRVQKNEPVLIKEGATVTLCDLTLRLVREED